MGSIHLVHDRRELEDCFQRYNPVLVQEYTEWEEQVRLMFVNFELVGALRRIGHSSCPQSFEPLSFRDPLLEPPLHIASMMVRRMSLDDTMIELGLGPQGWQLIAIARPPVRWPTTTGAMDRHLHICQLIQSGVL
jgi:hypothetical protein